jgi:hypothetical protein
MIVGVEFLAEVESEFSKMQEFKRLQGMQYFFIQFGSIEDELPKIIKFDFG